MLCFAWNRGCAIKLAFRVDKIKRIQSRLVSELFNPPECLYIQMTTLITFVSPCIRILA